MSGKTYLGAVRAMMAVVALSVGAVLFMAPVASADEPCPEGWVCGVTEPPVPPDQAGDPQTTSLGATQIPPLPPYVVVPMPPYTAPSPEPCKAKKHKVKASAHKKCKKKRHRSK